MAKIEMKGMDAWFSELRRAGEATAPVCKAAVYAGAKVVADAIKQSTQGLDTVSDAQAMANWQAGKPGKSRLPPAQGRGLPAPFHPLAEVPRPGAQGRTGPA